jgi:N,N-dimethylformamidase
MRTWGDMQYDVDHRAMAVAGYPHPWSQVAGVDVRFHLSCGAPVLTLDVVSLDGAHCPSDWGLRSTGVKPMVRQIVRGSCLAAGWDTLAPYGRFRGLSVELCLTRPQSSAVLALGDLRVTCEGQVLHVSDGDGAYFVPTLLPIGSWVTLELSEAEGKARLVLQGGDRLSPTYVDRLSDRPWPWPTGDFILGSHGPESPSADARFARPTLFTERSILAWQFPAIFPGDMVLRSTGDAQVPLSVVNLPTFSVRSCRWDGSTFDPRLSPDHYDAIHIHCDDVGAFDWPATHVVTVPPKAVPGVYALQVETKAGLERIPFFVRSRNATHKALVMLPTATYLAYLNEALPPEHFPWVIEDRGHCFARDNGLMSLYDFHADHSGCSITSTRKPLATLRDDYIYPLCGCPHLLPVDLRLLRFLRDQKVDFDVITDHDLHDGGAACLEGHDLLITGSHPEYMSVKMEETIAGFVAAGGSLAYLGGNGFAATVAFRDDLMELRRGPSECGRTWDGPLAEQALSLTGEPGGFLRHRGKGEFSLIGGAISLMGFGRARPFQRTPASHDPALSWLFEGVHSTEFGTEGTVLGGAAGYEVDATDRHLGTHPETIVVARADGFPDDFLADAGRWHPGGEHESKSRRCAEMTLRHLPLGGMIFSASSVAWCGALPDPGSMNDVGRITMNFLARALVPSTAREPSSNGAS